ncbi:MAG TPA: transcription antitermination factor NusB [Pseudonocardia sp.]|nr:transcription antitermination factor NusB [Pseudonocardia sp.]
MRRARTKARKRALDILFESEARGENPAEVLATRREGADAPPVSDYAAMLVEGVVAHRERIDQLLAEHAQGWTVARMPAVDRNLLRIAVFEMLWVDEVDDPVAISEAVELARELSTDDSPRFVNGVLGGIADIAGELRRTRL